MYTQFLGNYLLNKGAVTKKQLIEALEYQKTTNVKLGVLAIHAGYMNARQVEDIHIMQTHENKRFGELAIEAGYLTPVQVHSLLNSQKPDYLHLGQALVDRGSLTMAEFENMLKEYQSAYEITDEDLADEQNNKLHQLIQNFYNLEDEQHAELFTQYISILFNNIIRFIGKDFTPHEAVRLEAYPTRHCVTQKISGEFTADTAIDMEEDALIAFASRYSGEEFLEADEYVQASAEDFINLNNGLYVVNLSNEYSVESSLEPPLNQSHSTLEEQKDYLQLPVTFPFGSVNFIIARSLS